MSTTSPIGDFTYNGTNYGFTNGATSWSAVTVTRCHICRATVDHSEMKNHELWHDQLVEEMRAELIEMAKGLAVEVLKELAKQ